MEKIQMSEEQKQKLVALFKKRANLLIPFLIIGISGFIPAVITFFGESGTYYYSSPTIVFAILGIVFWSQSTEAIKKINNSDYQAYIAECKKVTTFGSAVVDNNEILSKKVKKPTTKIEILGSAKLLHPGEEIAIIQVGKEFWASAFNE